MGAFARATEPVPNGTSARTPMLNSDMTRRDVVVAGGGVEGRLCRASSSLRRPPHFVCACGSFGSSRRHRCCGRNQVSLPSPD
uniref:Uncharacterized protein n=1 Tax=Ascaris lumbricoides TaxID=6252 RepID=A0A0M3I9S9_ASCLU